MNEPINPKTKVQKGIVQSIIDSIYGILVGIWQFFFGKKRKAPAEEGFMGPIRVKLGPINIHIVGIPGDKRYSNVRISADLVKQVFDDFPISIQKTDVSARSEGAYPRILIDDQLWYVGEVDYEMFLYEIHSLIKRKQEKVNQMKNQFDDLRDKHRYFIVYTPAFFDNGVESNRTKMFVPTKQIEFEIKNLMLVPRIQRKGTSYSLQLHQSFMWNNQPVFDYTPYDVEPTKLEQVFLADGTMQWVK